MRRVDRTTVKISIGRHTIACLKFLRYLAPDVVKDFRLGCQILLPIRVLELFRAHFVRHEGVPWFEWQSPLCIVNADGRKSQKGYAY
jgi:hypothetical protein